MQSLLTTVLSQRVCTILYIYTHIPVRECGKWKIPTSGTEISTSLKTFKKNFDSKIPQRSLIMPQVKLHIHTDNQPLLSTVKSEKHLPVCRGPDFPVQCVLEEESRWEIVVEDDRTVFKQYTAYLVRWACKDPKTRRRWPDEWVRLKVFARLPHLSFLP